MNYNELIQLYFERSNALQWYWTLYVVIVGGLLAFSAQRQQRDFFTTMLVAVLFCFFAYENLDAIQDVSHQRLATLDVIKRSVPIVVAGAMDVKPTLEPTLNPPTLGSVRTVHVTSDALTVLTLLAMERRRQKVA